MHSHRRELIPLSESTDVQEMHPLTESGETHKRKVPFSPDSS